MAHLIWGLLNLSLLIYFIITCFKLVKVAKNQIGGFAAIVFVFGLLSFMFGSKSDINENKLSKTKTFKFALGDSLEQNYSKFSHVILENNFVTKYDLFINSGKEITSQKNTPISAYSGTTGLVMGTKWKPQNINVLKTADDDILKYVVYGIVEWKLLGAKVYKQSKVFQGNVILK
jgi:hypothetical protein